MQRWLLISFGLHIALLIALWLGLPVFVPPMPVLTQIVPVEIADIGAITNTRTKPTPTQETKPQPLPKPVEQPKPAPPKPPEPPKPVEQPKPEPTPPKPQPPEAKPVPKPPAPEPEPEEEALPEKPTPQPKKIAVKKPEAAAKKSEDAKPNPKTDALASILKNVAQIKPKSSSKAAKPDATATEDEDSAPDTEAPSLSDRLSISEEDSLRRQIGSCWNIPIGARDAEKLIVEVLIEVSPDRTVQSAKVVDQVRMATDSFFRAAAESALRALRHPLCSPLALPPDKYDQWKTIRFNFDPRDVL